MKDVQTDILHSLTNAPAGITISELLKLYPALPKRTLQRWLGQWVRDGQIEAIGLGRARRYRAASQVKIATGQDEAFPETIPLSPDSMDIVRYILLPLGERKTIGYQREFLDEYIPNQSWYLPSPLRRQLHMLGNIEGGVLPAGTYGREMMQHFLIDLSWASSHLEGNTYSLLDTRELIDHGRIATGKDAIETQMILNHKAAIEFLLENKDAAGFNNYTLFNLHALLSENLLPNPADSGRIREHTVSIGKSVYQSLKEKFHIEEMLSLLLKKASEIEDAFEQSFFLLVHLPYLQPFADVNKRTSRLYCNLPLLHAGFCPLTFRGIHELAYTRAILGVYEMTRVELLRDLYIFAYECSVQHLDAVSKKLVPPDSLRLKYNDTIKNIIRAVVLDRYASDAVMLIQDKVKSEIPASDQESVIAMIMNDLRRLHEGMLARYRLRPDEFYVWKSRQK